MIITRTPLRISFLGGGSDLPSFYREEPGAVISAAINKYIYITVNRKFDRRIRASYSVTEMVDRPEDLSHELIRGALQQVGIDGGVEITSISDVPSRGTGLGSSSSYTVGLLNALWAHAGRLAGSERLAGEACHIEIDVCGKPIGKQDQYIAAYGGLQYIQFNGDDSVFVDPILPEPELRRLLESRLLLLYTGLTRSAGGILQEQSTNLRENGEARAAVRAMVKLAEELRGALSDGDLDSFGELLDAGWQEKRKVASGVTSPAIDDWYARARASGALGGKLLGAGGGGFLLLYAPLERHQEIQAALPELRAVPFRFEPQGSKIIYVEEQQD
ncbi:MAG: GHMP kinase [Actinomycetota bacterium]|nr:GHMP kinase [Actinomycetota bacterium]